MAVLTVCEVVDHDRLLRFGCGVGGHPEILRCYCRHRRRHPWMVKVVVVVVVAAS